MGIFDFLRNKGEVKKNKKVTKTKDGVFQLFYKNNQLKQEYNYKKGKKNDTGKEYHQNGQLKKEGNWKNGKKVGLFKEYYKNGQLISEENFKDGKKDGVFKFWYENGQLRNEGNFKDGKQNGSWKSYYENGQLKKLYNWDGSWKGYYENGQLKEEESWGGNREVFGDRHPHLIGNFIEYDEDGKITHQCYLSKLTPIEKNRSGYREEELSKEFIPKKNDKEVIDEVILNYCNEQVYLVGKELKKGNGHRYMLIKTYHLNGQQKSEVKYDSKGQINNRIWTNKGWDQRGNFTTPSPTILYSQDLSYRPPSRSLIEIVLEDYIEETKGKYYPIILGGINS